MSNEDSKEKNEDAKDQAPPKRVATAKLKEPEQLIYIGPSIRKDGASVRTNQTFIGGRPPFLQTLYDEYPLMFHLFVPVNELAASKQKLKQIGSMINTAYRSMGEV